jgi:hypothetical protein
MIGKFSEYIDTPEAFEDRTKKKFSKVAGMYKVIEIDTKS